VAKLNFAVLCGRAIVDRETNQFSIIDIIEGITIKAPPEAIKDASAVFSVYTPMVLVADFSRSQANAPETVQLRVKALAPNGNEIGGSELVLDLQTVTRGRGFMTMTGLPVSSEGIYKFDVQVLGPQESWSTVTEVAFSVNIVPAA
jgi:hypothetical protein